MTHNFESTLPADKHSPTEPTKLQISDKFHVDAYDKHPTKTTEFKFFDEGIPLNVPYSQQKRDIEELYPTLTGRGTQTAKNYLILIDADQKHDQKAGSETAGQTLAVSDKPPPAHAGSAGDTIGATAADTAVQRVPANELDIRDLGKFALQHWKEMDKGDKGYITADDVKTLLKNPKIHGLERSTLEYIANNPQAICEASNDSTKDETAGRIYLRDVYRFFSDTNPRPSYVTGAIADDLRAHQNPKGKTSSGFAEAPATLPELHLTGDSAKF